MKMKKFLIIFCLFIVLICCISNISAVSDDIVNDTISTDNGDDSLSVDNAEQTNNAEKDYALNAQENNENILEETKERVDKEFNGDTFKELQDVIKSYYDTPSGGTIKLNKDVKNTGGEPLNLWPKNLIIDGNGHALDGNGAPIIQINTNDNESAILKNIIFKNGRNVEYQSAVSWWNAEGGIYNCTFINCSSDFYGGALISSYEIEIVDCTFKDCYCSNSGGAISGGNSSANSNILNCIFENCTSGSGGGAIDWHAYNVTISSCTFKDCKSKDKGGAIFLYDTLSSFATISSCNFINCFANNIGGGICTYLSNNITILNCNLSGCNSSNGSVVHLINNNAKISMLNFKNIHAPDGAIKAEGNNIAINGVSVNNSAGTAITVVGNGSAVHDVTIENNNGLGIYINGDNANVKNVQLNNIVNDNFLKVNSKTAMVDAVKVNGGKGETAVNVTTVGDASISNIGMANYDGTCIDAKSSEGNVKIINTTVTNGKGTVVKVEANKGNVTVTNVQLTNYTGKSAEVKSVNAIVTNLNVKNGFVTNPNVTAQNSTVENLTVLEKVNVSDDVFTINVRDKKQVFSIILPNATGELIVKVNGVKKGNATLKDGKASVTTSLSSGVYNVELLYAGDDYFAPVNKSCNITVPKSKQVKQDVKLTVKPLKKIYKRSATKVIKITLKSVSGKAITDKVTIKFTGKMAKKLKGKLAKKLKKGYTVTIKNGVLKLTLKNNLVKFSKKGKYAFTVTFKATNQYNGKSVKGALKVK